MSKFLVVVKANAADNYLASDSDKHCSEHYRDNIAKQLRFLQGQALEVTGEYFRGELRCYNYHTVKLLPEDIEEVIEV